LNHRKKTKADGSRLIPRKHTETLVLLSVTSATYLPFLLISEQCLATSGENNLATLSSCQKCSDRNVRSG